MKRQKSISSDAASISAWNTVFDCPSIVAALSVARQVVVSSSAARRNTAARSCQAQLAHSRLRLRGRRDRLLHVLRACGVPVRQHVPMVVRHHRLLHAPRADLAAADDERECRPARDAISLSRAFSSARSGEPGR